VCRPFGVDNDVHDLLPAAGERLLELRLVVDVLGGGVVDLLRERGDDRGLHPFEAPLEEGGCKCRLEQRGEHVPVGDEPAELLGG